ncbi:acyl coenzyme A thioester hydrolase [Thermoproteus uzoniensis 768-20]|uniref:Acyl coenzyme A thioester hydrolase n=1 Tax=Thermoproteus uzoniensis (strain 768-20) TaxID=999630 RepID=F2L207_THEU7|nr:hotdog domain-containing protein [Thermoproteus uzoniensis]AEA11748.1 acyl coenzyme A thioester hydrolase [Thermoproteus uzoniensis 768-20]
MTSISNTEVEVVRLVTPHNVNPIGTLYGGYMLQWLVDAGTIAAMDFSESNVVLGYLDRMHFVSPVKVGDVVKFKAWIVHVRRSSMTALVEAYVKRAEGPSLATIARMIFVKVGADDRPSPVGRALEASEDWERALWSYFSRWRESVEPELKREPTVGDLPAVTHIQVMPEDAVYGDLMYGGRLLYYLDQIAAISAFNYRPGIYVTASLNSINFRRPIYVGDIIAVRSDVDYVGHTSLEVAFEVVAKGLRGERRVASGYFTFVNMAGGRPTPIGQELVKDPDALRRKSQNLAEAKALRTAKLYDDRPAYVSVLERGGSA